MQSPSYIEQLWNQIPEETKEIMEKLQDNIKTTKLMYGVLDPDGKVHKCDLPTSIIWESLNPNAHKIAEDNINGIIISTVFLCLDHGFGEGLFFETMVFEKDYPQTPSVRAKSLESAKENHKQICSKIRKIVDHF